MVGVLSWVLGDVSLFLRALTLAKKKKKRNRSRTVMNVTL